MLSKFVNVYRIGMVPQKAALFARIPLRDPRVSCVRQAALIPPTQYDMPWPKKMQLGTMFRNNWEVIPLFFVTGFAITIMFCSIFWAVGHKVDISFAHTSCDTLSRNMDLRHPPVLKLIIIEQKYEPWPEMQDAVDKVRNAEKDLLKKASKC